MCKFFGGHGLLSSSLASQMRRGMIASTSYLPSENMSTVQHRGTEAIPRVRCSRPRGPEHESRGDLVQFRSRVVPEPGYIHRVEASSILLQLALAALAQWWLRGSLNQFRCSWRWLRWLSGGC